MLGNNVFSFPRKETLELCREFYAEINGAASFEKAKQWNSDVYSAEVHCSRGEVLEKAGLAMVCLHGGTVEGASADITLMQTLAWPTNPCVPGFIIMASTSRLEGQNVMVTFYTDLITQNGTPQQSDRDALTSALKETCDRHGQSLEEYQAFLAGRGMLGGCTGECGILYFFEESDAALLEDIIQEVLKAYRIIIDNGALMTPSANDFANMKDSRKRIVEWMLTQDYGVKVARENNIPLEVMESYGFPPPEHS